MTVTVNSRPTFIMTAGRIYDVVVSFHDGTIQLLHNIKVTSLKRHGTETTYWIRTHGMFHHVVVDCDPDDPRIVGKYVNRVLSVNGRSRQTVSNSQQASTNPQDSHKTVSTNIDDI